MNDQLATSTEALRMLFTEEIYLVKGEESAIAIEPQAVAVPTPETPAVTSSYDFMGKNQRQILILVNDPINAVSTEQGRELLRKLVKAIELTANDFALVNYANYPNADYQSLRNYFSSKVMFIFGVKPAQLGLPDCAMNSLVVHETVNLIFSADLHTLDGDQQGKKTLWGSLKQLTL